MHNQNLLAKTIIFKASSAPNLDFMPEFRLSFNRVSQLFFIFPKGYLCKGFNTIHFDV
jgi:hypothetical protein